MKRESPISILQHDYSVVTDDKYLEPMQGRWEPATARLLESMAYGTVLDVGANIGMTTLLHSRLADHVHAFEPSPTTFILLEENVERAECDNVTLHNFGLGDTPTGRELTYAPDNRSGAYVSDRITASEGHVIESIQIDTLDRFVEGGGTAAVDVIKIDVEGFEMHVLRGGARTLERLRPAVVLEMNHWCLNAFQRTSIPDFLDMLLNMFPIVLAVHEDHHLDARDASNRYVIMHQHILKFWYQTLVCAHHPCQVERLVAAFPAGRQHG
ncbi:hypothetical protein CO641_14095 [Lysobacteraceae bacterium NML91-0213]|nr:hypothetical protein CO641_14095 [Xanthomonadaceae bacterium NML91-0213]